MVGKNTTAVDDQFADDEQAGVTAPVTDRPLTAEDVALLREGDVLRYEGHLVFYRGADDGEPRVQFGREGWSTRVCPGSLSFVSRPPSVSAAPVGGVTSGAGEVVAWRYRYPNDTDWQLTQDHDQAFKNTGEVEPLGVIPFPSPPAQLSERERALERALRYAVGLLPGLAGAQNQPDNAVYTVMAAKCEIIEAHRLLAALTRTTGEG